MKQLFSLVFLLNSLSIFAQEPAYTPMRLNYQFRGIKVDSLFLVPSYTDTTQANNYTAKNIPGSLIRTGSDFWMRNGAATAWLQNVNVGPGASPTVQFVDSVWRVLGKDSIFWRKAGVTNNIKDSTGVPYAGDSPDRINGTATDTVRANMSNNQLYIDSANLIQFTMNSGSSYFTMDIGNTGIASNYTSINGFDSLFLFGQLITKIESDNIFLTVLDTMKINANEIKLTSTDSIKIDGVVTKTTGLLRVQTQNTATDFQAGDFPANDPKRIGNVIYRYAASGLDLSSVGYTAEMPGVYSVTSSNSGNNFVIPSAADWAGHTIVIINNDTSDDITVTSSSQIYDKGTLNPLNTLSAQTMTVFYSDGTDWYANMQ